MIAILDSSSLLALVRYYLPFDKSKLLYNLFEQKFEAGEIILLDKVYDEIKFISSGIILKELPFLSIKKTHVKTASLIPNKTFFNLLENQFCNQDLRKLKGITDTEFEVEKNHFLQSADANLLLYALSIKKNNPIVITEETKTSNDNKLFKKIPENCRCAGVNSATLPIFLKDCLNIDLGKLFG